jgi:rare lipoprotein A (peptidoglycan hydrolase)
MELILSYRFVYLVTCIALLILQGCSGGYIDKHHQVPCQGVNVSSKPYYCRGSWHFPQNHYVYEETGLASWYGPGFHRKPKPSGELFCQYSLTAAHRTLPLPTVARVTNLENGKEIIVLITDRGPYIYEGRIIDLSMASAKAVGSYGKGLAKVKVEALPEQSRELSIYLSKIGGKRGKCPRGRTWRQVFDEDMSSVYVMDTVMSDYGQKSNAEELQSILSTIPSTPSTKKNSTPDNLNSLDHVLNNITTPKTHHIQLKNFFIHKHKAIEVLNSLNIKGKVVPKTHPSGQKFYTCELGPLNPKDINRIFHYIQSLGYHDAVISSAYS